MSDTTDTPDVRFADLPGKPEVWKDASDNAIYMVYFVPGMEPEIPMLWKVSDPALLDTYREGQPWSKFVDRKFNGDEDLRRAGGMKFGEVDEVVLRGENPFLGWADQFEREAEVLPWLNDPEVAALWTSAYLEGRAPSEAELASTDWFRSKTSGEQRWLSLLWSQPETAKQLTASNRVAVRDLLEQAGVIDASDDIINYIADAWTEGRWTDVQRNNQIALLADPEKSGEMDTGLQEVAAGGGYTTTIDQERYVSTEVRKWLGPVYGVWTDDQIAHWAGRLRNDPNAKDQLLNHLSAQRMAMFPEYTNPDTTYDDIAAPWRSFATQAWGQQMDETSDTFLQVVKLNDTVEAGKLLRKEGLQQGIAKVENDFVTSIGRGFGEGVRGFGNVG